MAGVAGNRRTLYSKKVIRQAFQDLLLEKDFTKITIKEISERADINRGTIYKYYKDRKDSNNNNNNNKSGEEEDKYNS